jgi:hypothetical protein
MSGGDDIKCLLEGERFLSYREDGHAYKLLSSRPLVAKSVMGLKRGLFSD